MSTRQKKTWRRGLGSIVLGALVVGGGLVVPPASAAVTVEFQGRGYGHGRGLSQYGALGRANAGHTSEAILTAYYPGTGRGSAPDTSAIRVWITADTNNETRWLPEPTMTLTTPSGSVALPATVPADGGAPATPTQWRIRLISLTFSLEGMVAGTWRPVTDPAVTALLSNVVTATVSAADGTVRLVSGTRYRDYRGSVSANRVGNGSPAPLRTTVTTTLGSYLASVVPSEMPASWAPEALKAQAVAARTYAVYDRDVSTNPAWYDTCDSTQCQVYSGVADYTAAGSLVANREDARTTAAVSATAGVIVMSGGKPAFTQFSASNGGYSVAGSQPYLVAAPDPYDAYTWTASIGSAAIESAYPTIGSYRRLDVTRDGRGAWGGRTTTVTIRGSAGYVTVTGDAFRLALGLRSTLWATVGTTVPVYAPQRDWDGGGADLIARAASGRLYNFSGRPGATWAAPVQIGRGWGGMVHMTQVHNFLGTGKPEIISIHASGRLYIYPGTGSGGFGRARQIGRGWAAFDLLIGVRGWHQAGMPALIVRRPATGELIMYTGNGHGGFASARVIGAGWNVMNAVFFAGDWDGDGSPDLIAREASTGLLFLYRGDGKGGFRLPRVQIGHGWGGMDAILGGADWDRDGCYDVLARDAASGRLWLYPGNCVGGFGTARQVGSGWTGYDILR